MLEPVIGHNGHLRRHLHRRAESSSFTAEQCGDRMDLHAVEHCTHFLDGKEVQGITQFCYEYTLRTLSMLPWSSDYFTFRNRCRKPPISSSLEPYSTRFTCNATCLSIVVEPYSVTPTSNKSWPSISVMSPGTYYP